MLAVPIMRQSTTWTCGAAVVHALLVYFQTGFTGCEHDLWTPLESHPDVGTEVGPMIRTLRAQGLRVKPRKNAVIKDIRAALRAGCPCILVVQAWGESLVADWSQTWGDGHYVIATGIRDGQVRLMDPSTPDAYTYLETAELQRRWHSLDRRYKQVQGAMLTVSGEHPLKKWPGVPKRLG